MEEEKEIISSLGEIDLSEFIKEEEEKAEEEAAPGEVAEEEKEEPEYVEVSLSTQMLIGLVGIALSMRYLPDRAAVRSFNKKYQEEVPKVIENFGLEEVFEQVLSSTLTFKIKKTEVLDVPLPGWVGLIAVIGVLVIAGLFIKVPSEKEGTAKHKDMREGKEYGLTKEPRKEK